MSTQHSFDSKSSPNANLRVALLLAKRGYFVLLCCWPTDDGQCACGKGHTGHDIGRAPLTLHGVNDATTDAAIIERLCQRYPDANVAIDLKRSGLAAIDPDSEAAEQEARALGLPPTVSRHSRAWAYLYRLPAGCPTYCATRRGASKKIDVLSAGYLIVYGRHAEGMDIYLDPCDEPITMPLPSWGVEVLVAAASKTVDDVDLTIDDDEPPVHLYGDELRRWKGEIPTTDRSLYLSDLGDDLADAGMTAKGIVQALAERDRTLGFNKYCDRRDGGRREYARIAMRALKRERDNRQAKELHTWQEEELDADREAIEANELEASRARERQKDERIAQLERQTADNSELMRELVTLVIHHGGNLGIGLDMAIRCASASSRKLSEDGFVRYSPVGVAIDRFGAPTGRDPESEKERERLTRKVERGFDYWVGTGVFARVKGERVLEPKEILDSRTGELRTQTVPVEPNMIALTVLARRAWGRPDLLDFLRYVNSTYVWVENRGGPREPSIHSEE